MSTQEQLSYHEKGKRKKTAFSVHLFLPFLHITQSATLAIDASNRQNTAQRFSKLQHSTNKHRNCRRWNNGHWRQRVKSCESNCQLLRSLFYSFARKRRSRAFRQQQTLANPLAMTAAEEEEKDDDNDNWTTCFTAHLHKRGKQCC